MGTIYDCQLTLLFFDPLLIIDSRLTSSCSMSGQVIMGMAYGIDVAPQDDPYVSLAEKALHAVEAATITGWTFDMLPFCGPPALSMIPI
jgi:hypothetical protein